MLADASRASFSWPYMARFCASFWLFSARLPARAAAYFGPGDNVRLATRTHSIPGTKFHSNAARGASAAPPQALRSAGTTRCTTSPIWSSAENVFMLLQDLVGAAGRAHGGRRRGFSAAGPVSLLPPLAGCCSNGKAYLAANARRAGVSGSKVRGTQRCASVGGSRRRAGQLQHPAPRCTGTAASTQGRGSALDALSRSC